LDSVTLDDLKNLAEIIHSATFVVNPQGRITFYNRRAEELFGPDCRIDGEFRSVCDNLDGFLGVTGKDQGVQVSFLKEREMDGSTHSLAWTINRQASGQIYAVCFDFTDKIQDDATLALVIKELKDQKSALDQASIVAITDPQGTITYANDKFCEVSKYEREELIGQNHRILNSGHHPKEFFVQMWKTIASGKVWNGEVKNKAKDGTFYWVSTTIVPFLGAKDRPYQYVALRTDITDGKAALEAIEEERARTLHAEKMASLGEMAAGIAHELGNPIGSITSWLQIVSDAAQAGELEELNLGETIDAVKQRAEQMAKIITGMLTYARDGSKDPYSQVSAAGFVDKVLTYCSYKLRKAKVEVRNDIKDHGVYFIGRESEISQILTNLIVNSCDAIQELPDRWIALSANNGDDFVDIYVTDSGSGIPSEIVESMNKPFFTTKSAKKQVTGKFSVI
jgi:hypothetical protein